jgi:hypothetical protein
MRLDDPKGQSLQLDVVGYQFPHPRSRDDGFDFDANWLVINGVANDGGREWRFRDPCLLTTEGRALAAWLDAASNGRVELDATSFLEPNLEFRRVSAPVDPPVIRVTFRLEARPPWARGGQVEDWDSTWLEIAVPADALRNAAQELRSALESFPERR